MRRSYACHMIAKFLSKLYMDSIGQGMYPDIKNSPNKYLLGAEKENWQNFEEFIHSLLL